MTDFDPEKFEDKYVHYFPELQRAYKNAFEAMSERYDSELVHAIDQQILNESEPFYDDGAFRIELPDDPADRVTRSASSFGTCSASSTWSEAGPPRTKGLSPSPPNRIV
jgi:hypothetical protein